jgi:hypothetical protein
MTSTRPLRRTILHLAHRTFTDADTFNLFLRFPLQLLRIELLQVIVCPI